MEENLEADSEESETHGKGGCNDVDNNQINSVKHSSSLSSRGGRDYKMAMILKMGTGGDNQDHVSTPKSLKDQIMKDPYSNNFS